MTSRTILVAAVVYAGSSLAQPPQQPGAAPPAPGQTPIRIAVDLVRIDATVTDGRGRHVTDLTADDFEILQDGRAQSISTFSYVHTTSADVRADRGPVEFVPHRPPTRDSIRRTIAIIVDDLGLSFESTVRTRETLLRFVDNEIQPGDLVAILRTGSGMGALQQFTTDRRMLRAAAERIRWNMLARTSAFDAPSDQFEAERQEVFAAGTLGAIRYVVRGVGELPGRKSVIVISDGFRLLAADRSPGRVLTALHSLVDAANRAGVVIYTIDARGLLGTGFSADETAALPPVEVLAARQEGIRTSQDGLGYLANETGGLFVRNNNDIGAGVRMALDDQRGYYLLGYVPERSTFSAAAPRFHRLSVRVKRPGLRVRSRRGFFGVPDTEPKDATVKGRLAAAVTSPFASGSMRLRLTSFFGQVQKGRPFVQSVMHIDTRDITFAEQPDGVRVGEFQTLAVTFGENGEIAGQIGHRYTVRLKPDAYERALADGMVYRLNVPLKRPGPYQLRIALRDVYGDTIGSASQYIDIPDLNKGRLALSGLVIDSAGREGRAAGDGIDPEEDAKATVALRTFRQGTGVAYVCYVYNARRGRDGKPELEGQVRVLRDGAEIFRSKVLPIPPPEKPSDDPAAGGVLELGPGIPPGSYILEVAVMDRLAKKHGRATQTMDFEVTSNAER